jgi:hypothetical protein
LPHRFSENGLIYEPTNLSVFPIFTPSVFLSFFLPIFSKPTTSGFRGPNFQTLLMTRYVPSVIQVSRCCCVPASRRSPTLTASLPSVARYASISQLLRFPRRLIPSSRSPIGPGTRSGRRIGSFVCDGIVGNGLDSPLVWVGVFLLGISLRLMRSCF